MTLENFNKKTKMRNADERIIQRIVEMLDRCELQERIIDWNLFYEYCYEFFLVPSYIIERCIEQARNKTIYKLR